MLLAILLILLAVTVGFSVTTAFWPRAILALAGQYVIAVSLASRLVEPEALAAYAFCGVVTCLIFFLTLRQVSHLSATDRERPAGESRLAVGDTSYRAAAAVLAAAVTYALAQSYPLPGIPWEMTFAVYWLAVAGLFALTTASLGWRVAIGVALLGSSGLLLCMTTLGTSGMAVFSGVLTSILSALTAGYLLAGESRGGARE